MRPITASDLMNPHVLTVREDLTVQELAAFLVRNQITGAPVEDDTGRLVGVVSVTDIAEASLAEPAPAPARAAARDWAPAPLSPPRRAASPPWQAPRLEPDPALLGPDGGHDSEGTDHAGRVDRIEGADDDQEDGALMVRDIMTPAVVSVAEDATVSEIASKMLDGRVHRLLVTRAGQPLGIITTSDLLGLLVDER